MAGEWREVLVQDIAERTASGPFGSNIKASEYVDIGVPIIRGINLAGPRFVDSEYVFISEEKALELRSSWAFPGDVVFTARGSIGNVGFVPATKFDRYVLSPNLIKLTVNKRVADSLYVFYYFRSHLGQHEILSYASTTGVPNIARALESLRKFRLVLPPLPEQRAIAHILGTLDDKIELNRRMSETLEQMARAIFKAWFVDFLPVRAKMEGRWRKGQSLPGLPAHLYDLFPDRLVDSELGEIPEGWEVKPIGDLAEVVGGSTPRTERNEYWQGGIHHFATPKDLAGLATPVLLDTERKITDAGLDQISSGLLPAGTVLLSSRAPIGYLAIAEVPVAVNQGFIAMKPREGVSNLFLLRWAWASHEEIVSHANGSTFLEISKSSFRPIPVITPDKTVMKAFDEASVPLYRKVVEAERESRTLAAIRDALLPKLISGEMRLPAALRERAAQAGVKDAEKFLKERGL